MKFILWLTVNIVALILLTKYLPPNLVVAEQQKLWASVLFLLVINACYCLYNLGNKTLRKD